MTGHCSFYANPWWRSTSLLRSFYAIYHGVVLPF
jgi:succinate dehydrogenase hydrophobic anchor subunit